MLLDSDLADSPPIEIYKNIINSTIFIGCEVKSLYDERRIIIKPNNNQEPERLQYKPTKHANSWSMHLYGFAFDPKGEDRYLIKELSQLSNIDLITYNNILEKYNYKNGENYLKLTQNIFPLDNVHIERYIPNFNYDEFFSMSAEFPNFQQLTSINMYVLI